MKKRYILVLSEKQLKKLKSRKILERAKNVSLNNLVVRVSNHRVIGFDAISLIDTDHAIDAIRSILRSRQLSSEKIKVLINIISYIIDMEDCDWGEFYSMDKSSYYAITNIISFASMAITVINNKNDAHYEEYIKKLMVMLCYVTNFQINLKNNDCKNHILEETKSTD